MPMLRVWAMETGPRPGVGLVQITMMRDAFTKQLQ